MNEEIHERAGNMPGIRKIACCLMTALLAVVMTCTGAFQSVGVAHAATTHGDPVAMEEVLRWYGSYIRKLSLQPYIDASGILRYSVNEDMCRRLESKLIAKVLLFVSD